MTKSSKNTLLTTSPRRIRLNSADVRAQEDDSSPRRGRLNSREIPRTYSGLYGNPDDLLPFELNRQPQQSYLIICITYISLLVMLQLIALLISYHYSWTITNLTHGIFTLIYIHWIKGSINDEQGEMDHLTVWEQLEGTSNTKNLREVLFIVPTILTYVSCHWCRYEIRICAINIVVWCICMLAKLPFMNGVRLFGINRTAGIDDDEDEVKKKKKR